MKFRVLALFALLGACVHSAATQWRVERGATIASRAGMDLVRVDHQFDGWWVYDQREAPSGTLGRPVCGPYTYMDAIACAERQAKK